MISHMHMLICIIIFPITPRNTTFRPLPVCVICMCYDLLACLAFQACRHEDDVCAGVL